MERYTITIPEELLAAFDQLLKRKGYANRSEAIRDLIRNALVEDRWVTGGKVAATVTLVYESRHHELVCAIKEIQHQAHELVACTTQVMLDENNCLEVVVLCGCSRLVHPLAEQLVALKGIKHGQVSHSTQGYHMV